MRINISLFGFIAFIFCAFATNHADAQTQRKNSYKAYQATPESENKEPINYIANAAFQKMAWKLLRQDPVNFDYVTLRSQYAKTYQYDPIGDTTIERMQMLAFEASTTPYEQEAIDRIEDYNELLEKHIGHIGVVSQALALSRDDERFGNVEQLEKIRDGMFRSIMETGDGLAPESAYEIVTLAEEIAVLKRSGFQVMDTEHIKRGIMHYNAHEILTKDKIEGIVFTNVTLPMQKLEPQGPRAKAVTLRKF